MPLLAGGICESCHTTRQLSLRITLGLPLQGHKGWRYGYFDEVTAPGVIQPLEFVPGDSGEVLRPAAQAADASWRSLQAACADGSGQPCCTGTRRCMRCMSHTTRLSACFRPASQPNSSTAIGQGYQLQHRGPTSRPEVGLMLAMISQAFSGREKGQLKGLLC